MESAAAPVVARVMKGILAVAAPEVRAAAVETLKVDGRAEAATMLAAEVSAATAATAIVRMAAHVPLLERKGRSFCLVLVARSKCPVGLQHRCHHQTKRKDQSRAPR